MFTLVRKCLLLFFGWGLMACAQLSPPLSKVTNSGIEGQLLEQIANAMPTKGRPTAKGIPLLSKVYIYKKLILAQLENKNGALCNKINGQLVDSTFSDATGHYHLALKPGQYSIVVGYENGYFIPYFSGIDGVAYVQIEPQKTTILNINVNQKASY